MKINFKLRAIALLSGILLIASCSDDDDNPGTADNNIVVTAEADAELTIFVQALELTDLDDVLVNSSGSFTVLAPTNEAFAGISLSDFETSDLRTLLLNHVIASRVSSSDLTASGSGYAQTEAEAGPNSSKVSIYFNTSSGVRFNDEATVVEADIPATNGIIHKVDNIISIPDLTTFATADTDLSLLAGALTEASLVSALEADGPFTVLAPDVAAFTQFLSDNNWADVSEVPDEALSQTLLYHVIPDYFTSTTLTAETSGYVTTSSNAGPADSNLSIYYNVSGDVDFNGGATNNGATVSDADIVASNGVIHKVNAVIQLPNVTTFVVADPNFSTLAQALTTDTPSTDFVSILSRTDGGNTDNIDPPFTIFAPVNDAFAAITIPPVEADLAAVLQYHVVAGSNVRSSALQSGTVTTLNGDVTIDAAAPSVTGEANTEASAIILTDVQATNGVIHAIDAVLLPNL